MMATCKDCLHYEACVDMLQSMGFVVDGDGYLADRRCRIFKDKSRFFEVPCKPWDKVWIIDTTLDHVNGGLKKTICEGEIFKLSYNGFTTPMEWLDYRWDSPLVGQTTRHDRIDLCLGKTVFLTREEAEAALAERMKNDG